ncbi:hypothetical protein [Mycetocola reblochoni]|uniref:hypothetical protein n=1 Tax=Mycetocola reblochoni TaxID=331618 RepID=UPI003F96B69B
MIEAEVATEVLMSEADVVTVVLAVATILVAVLGLVVAVLTFSHQRLQARRDFAALLDQFALWYSERVISDDANDPGPTDALSDRTFALTSRAERESERGARELCTWALDLLNRLRCGTTDLREYEEAMLIATVASTWVKGKGKRIVKEIEKADPKYKPSASTR